MIREAIATAKTVDAAIEAGCAMLGADREAVEFEILNLPKKGLFSRKDAKVRVYIELPDLPASPARQPKPQPAAPRAEQPKAAEPRQPKPEQPRTERRAAPPKAQPAAGRPQPAPQPQEQAQAVEPTPEIQAKAQLAVEYVSQLLEAMELPQAKVIPNFTANGISLALSGEGLGVIIGHRGETLDSLQYLAGLVANRLGGDYTRVTIDSGNYRQKREHTLEALARKLANQAIRSGKSCTLEPMNPYERRIIHAAVSQIKGATSSSVGEEPQRRVVISPAGDAAPRTGGHPPREERSERSGGRGGRGGRSGGYRGGGGRGPRPPRQQQEGTPPGLPRGGYDNHPFSEPLPSEGAAQSTPAQSAPPQRTPAPAPSKAQQERALHDAELGGKLYGKIDI